MNRKIFQKRSINSFLTTESLLLLLMAFCTFLIYSSSIKGPFVFDDVVNIQDNPQIRLTELTLSGIVNAGFESPCPNRPVANISFALNYYFNRYDTEGFHFINILLHILTGIILFYLIKVTLGLLSAHDLKVPLEKNTPTDKGDYSIRNSKNPSILTSPSSLSPASADLVFISFFTAFIWLVHPLQTQTVSYIVQRMNGMAAMFYILSLLFYVKARLSNSKGKKTALFLGCILSGILSLGSKEIAATLPFFIFLYEWYFFQDADLRWLKRNSIYLFCLLFIISCLALFLSGRPSDRKHIIRLQPSRFYAVAESVDRISGSSFIISVLLYFQSPMRLNLLHDFPISHSFLDPITTLFSFVAIAGLLATAILPGKKRTALIFLYSVVSGQSVYRIFRYRYLRLSLNTVFICHPCFSF